MRTSPPSTSLNYLFFTFLKVGATSFGGFVALVSVLQDQLVEKDKKLDASVILEGMSLASVLPGPLAVNVSTYVGYALRGVAGGLIAMLAVLLPSFLLVYGLSVFYFEYGELPAVSRIFQGILPAVSAIILAVALRMGKKSIQDWRQLLIAGGAALALLLIGGFFTTLGVLVVGGCLGALIYGRGKTEEMPPHSNPTETKEVSTGLGALLRTAGIAALALLVLALIPLIWPEWPLAATLRDLVLTFSGMSVTLFGGGYVMIPSMHEVIVNQLGWLSTQEFADGIAMGQFTPGPILISAAFMGYKMAGLPGALLSTVGIFLPPALLMLLAAQFLRRVKDAPIVTSVFKGLHPAVIGMIASAAYTLVKDVPLAWQPIFIFIAVLVLATRFQVNAVYLIPLAGVLGWVLF